nr:NADH dehydrogenase subunit 6 [Harmonia axyridis]
MLILTFLNFLAIFLTHPLSLGLLILTYTIMTCIIMGLMSSNFWFSYILMLIMIGGLLILFIYMTSTASNEKFKFNKYIMFIMISLFMITMFMNNMNLYLMNQNINNEILHKMDLISNFYLNLNKFLNYPNSNMFLILVFYLLISMIAVVKITKVKFGPLRQFK